MALKLPQFAIAAGAVVGLLTIGLCGLVSVARAQQGAPDQDVETIQLRPNFYMIAGGGSNIAVQVGVDGVVLVDAGAEAASDRVIAAVKRITDQPIRYIIDTNADADHVSGNTKVAKSGRNIQFAGSEPLGGDLARDMTNGFAATVLASEGVLSRMSAPTGKTAAYPSTSWPQETFYQDRRYIYMNGEGVEMFRMPAAHSDGDIAVFFRASDVIAAGDVLDMTRFPMIDPANGGSIQGEIDALNRIIKMTVTPIPFIYAGSVGTYVIPGHGRACEQLDVVEYRDMVVTIRDIVKDLINSGKTLEQVKVANPAGPWAPRFGAKTGPWTTDAFIEAIYKSLKGATK